MSLGKASQSGGGVRNVSLSLPLHICANLLFPFSVFQCFCRCHGRLNTMFHHLHFTKNNFLCIFLLILCFLICGSFSFFTSLAWFSLGFCATSFVVLSVYTGCQRSGRRPTFVQLTSPPPYAPHARSCGLVPLPHRFVLLV